MKILLHRHASRPRRNPSTVEHLRRLAAALLLSTSTAIANTDDAVRFAAALPGGEEGCLTLAPGTVTKFACCQGQLNVDGTLIAQGTETEPIVFTSLNDERYGFGGTFDTNRQLGGTEAAPGGSTRASSAITSSAAIASGRLRPTPITSAVSDSSRCRLR